MLKKLLTLFGQRSGSPPASTAQVCVGTWVLNNVGGQPPPLALHIIRVARNEMWESESLVLHEGGGYSEVRGGGVWKVREGTLQYTVGDKSGRTEIRLNNGRMVLARDPMLQLTNYNDK